MVETTETQTVNEKSFRLTSTDLLLLLMSFIWGSNFTAIKYSLEDLQPLAFNGLRMSIAAILLVISARLSGVDFSVPRRDLLKLFGLGLLANTCYQGMFIIGMSHTRAGNAALIVSTTPLFTALYGWLRKYEYFTARGILGLVLAFGGIILIVLTSHKDISLGETLLGDSLLLAATICWSLHTVGSRSLVQTYGSTKSTAIMMATGTPTLLLICAPALYRQDWSRVRPIAWGGVVYSACFAIALAYVIWNHGVRRLGTTHTAVFGYVTPVVAMLVAWVALGETPGAGQIAGAFVIIFGLYLVRGGLVSTAHKLPEDESEQPA
jgi:drug/metabolite transporter (DMT)-like permease